jgi:hypothetical protein
MIKPEQMSLAAHSHIQKLLTNGTLTEEDVNSVQRLSQHLRVFGLLSAAGHINQSNQQKGKIKERTVPVWTPLLAQLLWQDISIDPKDLMDVVLKIAKAEVDNTYMLQWRRSLEFSQHWNFWARAYKEEKQSDE